jgi:hypothetical protein
MQQTSAQSNQQNDSTRENKKRDEKLRIGQNRAKHLSFFLSVTHSLLGNKATLDAEASGVVNWESFPFKTHSSGLSFCNLQENQRKYTRIVLSTLRAG